MERDIVEALLDALNPDGYTPDKDELMREAAEEIKTLRYALEVRIKIDEMRRERENNR